MQPSSFWRVLAVLLVAHVLQTTWLGSFQFNGAHPDLPFLVALSAALLAQWEIGAIVGIGAGILSGLAAAWHPGSFLISRAVPAALLGSLSRRFSIFHPFAPPFCAFGATLVADFLFMLISPTDFKVVWWAKHAVSSGILHALLIWPVFWVVVRLVKPPQRSLFTT